MFLYNQGFPVSLANFHQAVIINGQGHEKEAFHMYVPLSAQIIGNSLDQFRITIDIPLHTVH